MPVTSLHIKQFRCFESRELQFDSFATLIQGSNGSGKTSILEAISYLLTARSFKTSSNQQVIKHGMPACSISGKVESALDIDMLTVILSNEKKVVKINQKTARSFQDLRKIAPAIMLTEDDLELVKGTPSHRRVYIDHIAMNAIPEYGSKMRTYKHVLDNRNALLFNAFKQGLNQELYSLWTTQLLQATHYIRQQRIKIIDKLNQYINELCKTIGYTEQTELVYDYSYPTTQQYTNGTELLEENEHIAQKERNAKRSIFGAHLDDITIYFNTKNARQYASRGQQKLVLFLLKIAQAKYMHQASEQRPIFLLDDIMTDFDRNALLNVLELAIETAGQIIATSPINNSPVEEILHTKTKCNRIKIK